MTESLPPPSVPETSPMMVAEEAVPSEAEEPAEEIEILQPNATLYVSSIDWSIKKPILRRALLALFGRHGKVLEVITLRREGLRGQAWIIFEDIASATAALRTENGFTFFGKDLNVSYAREKSDRVAKRDGSFIPKDRRVKKPAPAKRPRVDVVPEDSAAFVEGTALPSPSDNPPAPPPPGDAMPPPASVPAPAQTPNAQQQAPNPPSTSPSKILFAQNLPEECNEMMLTILFRQYAGFKEVRFARKGLAFVEFDDEPHATLALKGLSGFQLTTKVTLDLKYAKE